MATATEFRVVVENRPGTLAQLGSALGEAGVNIEAIQGTSHEERGFIHFVANDPEKAGQALDAAGILYTKREVLIVRALDEPGMLGNVALAISKAGINIDSVYVTTRGHIVLGVDDLAGATQVAGGMAAMPSE